MVVVLVVEVVVEVDVDVDVEVDVEVNSTAPALVQDTRSAIEGIVRSLAKMDNEGTGYDQMLGT